MKWDSETGLLTSLTAVISENSAQIIVKYRLEGTNAWDPLQVSFTNSDTSRDALPKVQFTSHITGGEPPYTFSWNFTDGTMSDEANPIHHFGQPGAYDILLTVTDSNGNTASYTQTLMVKSPLQIVLGPAWPMVLLGILIAVASVLLGVVLITLVGRDKTPKRGLPEFSLVNLSCKRLRKATGSCFSLLNAMILVGILASAVLYLPASPPKSVPAGLSSDIFQIDPCAGWIGAGLPHARPAFGYELGFAGIPRPGAQFYLTNTYIDGGRSMLDPPVKADSARITSSLANLTMPGGVEEFPITVPESSAPGDYEVTVVVSWSYCSDSQSWVPGGTITVIGLVPVFSHMPTHQPAPQSPPPLPATSNTPASRTISLTAVLYNLLPVIAGFALLLSVAFVLDLVNRRRNRIRY